MASHTVSTAASALTLGSFRKSSAATALTTKQTVAGTAASAVVSRTQVKATPHIAVLHRAGSTYPTDFLPVNTEATLPNPASPPYVAAVFSAGTLTAGTWWVSYAYTNCTDLGTPSAALANGTTLPSAPVSIVLVAGQVLSVSVPGEWPVGTTAIRWYLAKGASTDTRYLAITSTVKGTTTLTAPSTTVTTENAENTTIPVGLVFGRGDDESGSEPVPIHPTTPFSAYSWYKQIQLALPVLGVSSSTISRFTVRGGGESAGLRLFYKTAGSYTICNGIAGTASANYPPDDSTNRRSSAPNTPSGYAPLTETTVVFDSGSYSAASTGGKGTLLQLVAGVADRAVTGSRVGAQSLPTLVFGYDEF